MTNERRYEPVSIPGWRGRVCAAWTGAFRGDPLVQLFPPDAEAVRARPTAVTVRTALDGRTVYAKHATGRKDHDPGNRRLLNRLRWRFGPSPALRALRIGRAMARAGFDVPPVVLAARRPRGAAADDLLVTEAIDARSLYDLMDRAGSPENARLFEAAGRLVARLHRARFVHGDLPGGNLLRDGSGRWYVIDNERTRRWWPAAPAAMRRTNLVQMLYRSLGVFAWSEARRFLDGYFEATGGGRGWQRRQRLAVLRAVRRRFVERRRAAKPDRVWPRRWR